LTPPSLSHLVKNLGPPTGKDYRIGTLHCDWPMSAHASQAFGTSTVPIWKIYPYQNYVTSLQSPPPPTQLKRQ